MPPNAVPQKFIDARAVIRKDKSVDGSAIDTALKGWSPSERTEFLRWYVASSQSNRREQISKQQQQPALSSPKYIKALQAVNFADPSSIEKFIALTQDRDHQPRPEPVLLGLDNSFEYYLCSQLAYLDIANKLPESTVQHQELIEFISPDGKQPPLQYALHLGKLEAIPAGKDFSSVNPIQTPFRVWVDAITRSVWLVLDPNPVSQLGDPVPIDPRDDPWEYLPSPRNSRPSFDVMQVLRSEEIGRIDNYRPLFSKAALGTAQRRYLEPHTVAKDVIGRKIPDKTGPPAAGPSRSAAGPSRSAAGPSGSAA